MFLKIILAIGIICQFTHAASVADSLYSQAQKLFSQKNFEVAAKAYAEACLKFEAKEKKACMFNEVKALVESQKVSAAQTAEPKLLSLLSQTEPGDYLFTELSAEDAKLQIMLNQPARAIRSWNAAQASANIDNFSEIYVICQDIISAFPEGGLTAENCNKVKPTDTTLISLPRKKVTPLSTSNSPLTTSQPPNPKPNTTNPIPTSQPTAPQTPNPIPQSSAPQPGKWYIQLGAYGNRENAERLVSDFKSRGVQLYVAELADRKLFAVRAGNFANKEEAESFAEQKIAPAHKDYKIFQ